MPKRERCPNRSDNAPEAKKPKLVGSNFQFQRMERPAPDQRPNSPAPGPSTAPSDPALRGCYHSELVPIYRYFDPTQPESSSQASTSVELVASPSAAVSCSTSMETDESQSTLDTVEKMEVDSDTPLESMPSGSKESHYRQFYRQHRSRRDQ